MIAGQINLMKMTAATIGNTNAAILNIWKNVKNCINTETVKVFKFQNWVSIIGCLDDQSE